jgi:hypothetical protein
MLGCDECPLQRKRKTSGRIDDQDEDKIRNRRE